MKQLAVEIIYLDQIDPSKMEFGKLYISVKYHCMNHLCLCGCGHEAPIPIKSFNGEPGHFDGWDLTEIDRVLSVTPSLLHRFDCKSHYVITNNVANFC